VKFYQIFKSQHPPSVMCPSHFVESESQALRIRIEQES